MVTAITTNHSAQVLGMVRKAEEEISSGNRSGNFALVTAAKLRRVVATMDVEAVKAELLGGMGISAEVSPVEAGIMIEVRTPHSLQTVMNALRSTFDVLGAMGRNGRMAIRVALPAALPLPNDRGDARPADA